MRRTAGSQPKKEDSKVIEAGDLRLDCESRRLFILNKEVNLTAKEFDVLELLVKNPNKFTGIIVGVIAVLILLVIFIILLIKKIVKKVKSRKMKK